jgi:hypothetical protein
VRTRSNDIGVQGIHLFGGTGVTWGRI